MIKLKKICLYTISILVALLFLFPFILIVINSLKDRISILKYPMNLPISLNVVNYIEAINKMNYLRSFTNSLILTVGSTTLLVVFSSMFAYYLARINSKFKVIILGILVASMTVPFQALMIPFVSIFGKLQMLNSKWWLMIFYLGFGVPLSTFLYHGFIRSIPYELDEAAMIDGAGEFRLFWTIIFPVLKSTTVTVIILNVLWIWNDYLLPSLCLFQKSKTLPLSTYAFYGTYTSDYGLAMAGLVLSIAPIIIFYIAMQKNIISGVTQGSVK